MRVNKGRRFGSSVVPCDWCHVLGFKKGNTTCSVAKPDRDLMNGPDGITTIYRLPLTVTGSLPVIELWPPGEFLIPYKSFSPYPFLWVLCFVFIHVSSLSLSLSLVSFLLPFISFIHIY